MTKAQLDAEDTSGDFWFNGLNNPARGWIITDGATFTATRKFIEHVHKLYPA